MADWGILLLRVVVGSLLISRGLQKLLGWFGGEGFRMTSQRLVSIGYRPGGFWTSATGVAELGGGLLLALGLFSPIGPILIMGPMLTATFKEYWPRLWASEGGFELPLVNMAAVLAVAFTGPGFYSLDNAANLTIPSSDQVVPWIFGLMVLGVFVGLASSASEKPVMPARRASLRAETGNAEPPELPRAA